MGPRDPNSVLSSSNREAIEIASGLISLMECRYLDTMRQYVAVHFCADTVSRIQTHKDVCPHFTYELV
jgi:inhibitor of KinA sporulation pathway (predicted exonuclease)